MADQEGNEVGAHAQGGGRGERYHAVDGHELGGAGGGDEWSGRDVGGSQAGNNFCGHEHGGGGVQQGDCRESAGKRRRHGGLAGFRKRDYAARRQAFRDGGRAQRNVRESEAVAAGYWTESDARGRERTGAGDEDWRELEPGGADAGIL